MANTQGNQNNLIGAEMNESRSYLEESPMLSVHRGNDSIVGMETGLNAKKSQKI